MSGIFQLIAYECARLRGCMYLTKPRLNHRHSERFVSLMNLYEQNYILLKRLLPNVEAMPDYTCIRTVGCLDLHVWIEERAKYTTTLRLSYQFKGVKRNRLSLEPNLTVRIYHDAQTAETMSAIVNGKPRVMRFASTLEWRWSLNRFLFRWLRYLLHKGYHRQ